MARTAPRVGSTSRLKPVFCKNLPKKRRQADRRVSYGFETYNPICQRKAGSFLSVNIWTTMALGQNVSDGVANPVRQEGQNVSDGVANPVRQETPSGRKPRPAGNPVRQETPCNGNLSGSKGKMFRTGLQTPSGSKGKMFRTGLQTPSGSKGKRFRTGLQTPSGR